MIKKFARGYTPGEVTVHHDPAELTRVTKALRSAGRRIALVPTMGALHEGHKKLITEAKRIPGTTVVVSIFVNPLQFGENEDLAKYPRTLDDDVKVCQEAGAELVFAPSAQDMYPNGRNVITVHPGPLGDDLEGASRPGHFAGVLTVVTKLFNVVQPEIAFFGEKDYQQLVLIKKMVAQLNLGVDIVGVQTVRENDGVALSSRNRFLDARQRELAVTLSAALTAGASVSAQGADAVLTAARKILAERPEIQVDYLEIRDTELAPNPGPGNASLLIAAKIGTTRLIDNKAVLLGA
jgi:pantoate--beta-alanine ligase